MIDPEARQQIRTAVDDFIAKRITAFVLDDRLHSIQTKDATAIQVIRMIWCTYDDMKDHGVEHWNKPTWDFIQRLLLLLESGGELVTERRTLVWRMSQLVALAGLALVAALYWGVYHYWFIPVLVGGVISQSLAWWRDRHERMDMQQNSDHEFPFASSHDIRLALRRMPGWRKQRHPGEPIPRLRAAWIEHAYNLLGRFLWCMVSPLALTIQALPQRRSINRVVMPI